MTKSLHILAVAASFLLSTGVAAQQVHYVKADATGANDGSSWINAYTSLQDAISAANSGDEIWVAAGEYSPDAGMGLTPGDRSLSFELKSGVRVHGGFSGTEATRAGRDLAQNRTVLSGDLARDDDGLVLREDNSYHVVRAMNTVGGTLLDGLTIVGGQADGIDADSLGGGILIEGGEPWIVNTRINSSVAGCGGGVASIDGATPTFVNVIANGNRASTGGGVCNLDSDPEITNATITGNTARLAPGIYNMSSSPSIANSIITGNRTYDFASHCAIYQYPCSVADVADDVLQKDAAVNAGASVAMENGALQDAIDYVSNHPDVIQVLTGPIAVGWRVAGGAVSMLIDGTGIPIDIPGFGKGSNAPGAQSPRLNEKAVFSAGTNSGKQSDGHGRLIFGEDLDGNGKYDQRDGKRALILSPFGFADAEYARQSLLGAPGYGIQDLSFHGPSDLIQDQSFAAWGFWDRFDLIYLSTITAKLCPLDFGQLTCKVGILTVGNTSNDLPGVIDGKMLFPQGWLDVAAIGQNFFDWQYGGSLDNALVHCAYCDFGGNPGPFSSGMGMADNRFALGAWDLAKPVDYESIAGYNAEILDDLVVGLFLEENSWGSSVYSPGPTILSGGRIIELPILMYSPTEGSDSITPLADLTDISEMIEDTIGDDENDRLRVRQFVYGVNPELSDLFSLRFEVNGNEIPVQFSLVNSSPSTFSESVYDFRETIDLGFPVKDGFLFLESIVELPDGTESRYNALASVNGFSCTSSTQFNGYKNGAFTGAATWNESADIASLTIESSAAVLGFGPAESNAFGPSSFNSTFILTDPMRYPPASGVPMDSTTYTVITAALTSRYTGDGWSSVYRPNDRDCPDCEARVRVDSIAGQNVYGKFGFIGRDLNEGRRDDPKMSLATGTFNAVPGNAQDIQTPYWQCLNEYWTTYEEATSN